MRSLPQRRIGDLHVSALGMGAMTLTQTPEQDSARGRRAVEAALESGITLFDTADSYGPTDEMGVNERALIAALRSHPGALDHVVVSTKGGHTRGPNATWWVDGSPEHLARAARESALRLGFEALPLFHLHRPDVKVPLEDSLGALAQLVDDGVVVRVGVSNVDADQLLLALDILGDSLVSVQNEYSPLARGSDPVLRLCEEHGLAFLAWGPLGGMRSAKGLGEEAAAFRAVAAAREVSVQVIALAWLLRLSPVLIPIPGASRPESVRDSCLAPGIDLTDEELAQLNGSVA